MAILVVSKTTPLPHTIVRGKDRYVFSPFANLPDDLAGRLLKQYPHLYSKGTGKESSEGYTFKEEFKKQAVVDMFNALSDEQKGKVVNFIQQLQSEGQTETPDGYDGLKKDELMNLIETRRSAGRTIEPKSEKVKDLIAALEADDQAQSEQ